MRNIQRLGQSFRFAFRGIRFTWRQEQSFRVQVAVATVVVLLMIFLPTTKLETVVLSFLIMAVLVMELLNSTLERIIDTLQPRIHPFAQEVKDMMAAAVLITAMGSLFVGILIVGPYLLRLGGF
ncbi:MAG: diacylglycerol kinase [Patescibacteria group bacterium]